MLGNIRKNTKAIVWAAVGVFILWGAFSLGNQFQKQGRIAGEVFGKEVTFQEFNRFYKSAQIFNYSGDQKRDPESLRRMAWDSLIYSREAKRLKIEVSDDETRQEVLRLLAEAGLPNPSPEQYRTWLQRAVGGTPSDFESQIREILRIRKLFQRIPTDSETTPTDEELRRMYRLGENQLSIEKVTFDSYDKAQAFRREIKSPAEWESAAKNAGLTASSTGFLSLQALMQKEDVSEADASKLLQLEKGAVSEPVRFGKNFAVARLADKISADEKKFESEFKPKVLGQLKQQTENQKFVEWHIEIQARAALKDYTQPEPAA